VDFRLASVTSINVSGHRFGLVYPGVGWLVFRDDWQLPEELVFYEDYLGERDATFTLNSRAARHSSSPSTTTSSATAGPATPR
jgi:glutamate/tyrosine decarboxylase-like PLP-dependent enzyme